MPLLGVIVGRRCVVEVRGISHVLVVGDYASGCTGHPPHIPRTTYSFSRACCSVCCRQTRTRWGLSFGRS
jgi:hypothetical protein